MADDNKERARALEMAVGQIEKQFGKGSIMRLGQKDAVAVIPSIPTGSISIDYALGVGGMPRGRVIEIYGPESSGKTTLALQVIARPRPRAAWPRSSYANTARRGYATSSASLENPRLAARQRRAGLRCEADPLEPRRRRRRDSVAALVPRQKRTRGRGPDGPAGRLSPGAEQLTGAVSSPTPA